MLTLTYAVLLVALKDPSSAVLEALIFTTRSKTICIKEQESISREVPTLPYELVDMVVNFAIEQGRSAGEGSSLCTLMHTKRAIRLTVIAEAFDEIDLYDCESQLMPAPHGRELRVPSALHHEIQQMLRNHMLLDFSARRTAGALREASEKLKQKIIATDGSHITAVTARVTVSPYYILMNGKFIQRLEQTDECSIGEDDDDAECVWFCAALCALQSALKGVSSPRILNACQRALSASFRVPNQSIEIRMQLNFRVKPSYPLGAAYRRHIKEWKFSTLAFNPAFG